MKTTADKLKELKEREEKERAMGGEKGIAKHKEKGKLTARERVDRLFDPGTFVETDLFVKHRCQSFGMEKLTIPAEGVVTGYGKVNHRTVCAYSQDFTSRGGSLGEKEGRLHVGTDKIVPLLPGDGAKRRGVETRGVVDEDAQVVVEDGDLIDDARDGLVVEQVALHGVCRVGPDRVELLDECSGRIDGVAVVDHDVDVMRMQFTRDGCTDTCSAPRDQCRSFCHVVQGPDCYTCAPI